MATEGFVEKRGKEKKDHSFIFGLGIKYSPAKKNRA
jgi:hypothetical protein